MRLQLPERIPPGKVLLFSSLLMLVELIEGTDPTYAVLVFCYFMLSVFAFNIAGGFTRPSGAYVFFYSTLVAGVGTVYKALLGQAADTHLASPRLVMGVYVGTVAALLMGAYLARKIAITREGVAGVMHVPKIDLNTSALGCFVIVLFINNAYWIFPAGSGSIMHAILMVNYFLPLGILLGTIAAVRNSNGRNSVSALTATALIYSTYTGMVTFSKQGMFTPFVCWIMGLAWSRFRLRLVHIIAIIAFAIVAQEFMTPLANVGRVDNVTGTEQERVAITEHYLLHPLLLKRINKERVAGYSGLEIWYYGSPQGIFDRLTMLPNDSQLIDFTAHDHFFGYLPLFVYIQNWVPHIINPNKVDASTVGGNRYAHEMGQLADEDSTTGISFSPSAESFHMGGWICVLLVQPLVFLLLFAVTDSVCGDLRVQPWGLLPLLLFSHVAPEQLLGGSINYVWLGNVGTIFAIFVCGYVTPVFGRLLKGRDRAPVWRANLAGPMGSGSPSAEAV
ncbi:MAG TPA: hypothetical protein VKV02_09060 [Acidobacteriaceae bacterium]|nr:hypothetical protein [Acidobacteriaceae bacterium]